MARTGRTTIEPAVFLASGAVVLFSVGFGVVAPETAQRLFLGLQDVIVSQLGWLFRGATALFLLFSVLVCFGRVGRIRLGPDGEAPAYGFPSWFAMLFSAGMGIGIMFYGVAEPVLHYALPPAGAGGDRGSGRTGPDDLALPLGASMPGASTS